MGIPDTVMGLTFVAAGVSIPDILTSLAVAREGENYSLKESIQIINYFSPLRLR